MFMLHICNYDLKNLEYPTMSFYSMNAFINKRLDFLLNSNEIKYNF